MLAGLAGAGGTARRVHRLATVCWAFLLLVAATGVQTRSDSRLLQAERTGLNVNQVPWGIDGLEHDVVSKQAGTSGVFLPRFANQDATNLKPHTVLRPGAQGARACAPSCANLISHTDFLLQKSLF